MQYVPLEVFLYAVHLKVVLRFDSVDEILKNERLVEQDRRTEV